MLEFFILFNICADFHLFVVYVKLNIYNELKFSLINMFIIIIR